MVSVCSIAVGVNWRKAEREIKIKVMQVQTWLVSWSAKKLSGRLTYEHEKTQVTISWFLKFLA